MICFPAPLICLFNSEAQKCWVLIIIRNLFIFVIRLTIFLNKINKNWIEILISLHLKISIKIAISQFHKHLTLAHSLFSKSEKKEDEKKNIQSQSHLSRCSLKRKFKMLESWQLMKINVCVVSLSPKTYIKYFEKFDE